ncbi:MAG: TIGR03621 family F420-dependent LLM class oxidoreductase [Actinomycetota bacterium]
MVNPFRFGVSGGALTDPHEFVALARRAEELGYSSVAISDHLDDGLAPLIALAAAATATERIRLSTLVLANDFRNPVVLAKELATLDQLSGGRVEWGIGAGWKTTDYERAAIPLERPGVRIDALEASIATMRAAFADERGLAASVQRPHPPLILAGGGPRVLGLAGREADIVGINFSLAAGTMDASTGATGTPDRTDEKIAAIRAGAGDRIDAIEIQTRIHLVLETDDRAGTLDAMAPGFGLSPTDAAAMPHTLVGTIDEMCESLVAWRERWGISYVTWSADAIDTMAPVVERMTGA